MNKIIVYPDFDPSRYAFYFEGLYSLFPKHRVLFSRELFPDFHQHCLSLIIGENPGVKIYISTGDGPGYKQEGLDWADVYIKRTLLVENIPQAFASKIIPGGPHIETSAWNLVETIALAFQTYLFGGSRRFDVKSHLQKYFQQYFFRLPEKEYVPGKSKDGYVFYAATLYPTHPGYNRFRATFINACLATSGLQFEGGLIRKDNFRVPEYGSITISKYYHPRDWLEKVKSSMLGFWAPGDQGAMTLKMAEFMACGKAIIAVPIRQEQLPSPLVHGEHVHFVDGSLEEMKAAVRLLTTDHEYRHKLERNARKYYEEWVAPAQAVRRFIREGCQRAGIACEEI